MSVHVSVVVPTYRRPDLLHRCLSALVAQEFEPAAYEIIVADDAASDEMRRSVEKWSELARPGLRYVSVTGSHGPAAARNAGWRAARGEVIAFTDDDCVPDPGWLKAGAAAFTAGVAAATGRLRMPVPEPPTDYERNEAGLGTAEFITANCFCRRSVLEAVGGFDERFGMAWREDSDLHFTLLERGHWIARAPEALVVHPLRPGWWGISLRQQRKALYNALLYKKHPLLYRQRIQRWPPWHYYASAAAVGGAVSALLAGAPALAAGAGAVWSVLVARFCARRLWGTSHAARHVAEMVVTSALIPLLSIYWRLRGAVRFRVLFL